MASFLLAIDQDRKVREVPLEAETAQELGRQFDRQAHEYILDREEVPYEPAYSPPQNEIMVLDYELPSPLSKIQKSLPSGIPKLDPKSLEKAPPVALVWVKPGTSATLCFQAIDERNLLRPNRAIWVGSGNFKFNKQTGIAPKNTLDALYEGGRLLFRSEHQVRRFLDFEKYFKTASDKDLKKFFKDPRFEVEDMALVNEAAGTVMRRKIKRLLTDGASFEVSQLKVAAEEARITLVFKNQAVVVPAERKELRELVDLLSHAYVRSLTAPEKLFFAPFKRPIAKA